MTLHPDDGLGEQFVLLDTCFRQSAALLFPLELDYFTELVALFADLCVGRNFTCSNQLRVRFPIGVVLHHVWHEELSLPLRAAFTRLLQSLYVDAYPREEVIRPALCRTLERLDASAVAQRTQVQRLHSLSRSDRREVPGRSRRPSLMETTNLLLTEHEASEIWELYIGEDEETLFQLKEDLLAFMHKNVDLSALTELHLCIMKLANQLLRFGLFGTCCSNLEERRCLFSPLHKDYSAERTDLVRLARAVRPLLGSLEGRLLASKRRVQSLYNTVLAQVLKDPSMMADSVVRASVATRNLLTSAALESEEANPYELAVRCEALDLFHYVLDCRQDFLVNNALEWFLQEGGEPREVLPPVMRSEGLDTPSHCFRALSPELLGNLDEMLDCKGLLLAELLLLLIKSTDFHEQTQLIHLLARCYGQRAEMTTTLEAIYVVSSQGDVDVFRWLQVSLPQFKQQAEQSEIWLKFWQQSQEQRQASEATLAQVTRSIQQLRDLLMRDSLVLGQEVQPPTNSEVSEVRQTIMYFLHVHTLVVGLIRDGMGTLEEASREGAGTVLKLLFSYCHSFLRYFAQHNTRNQEALFQYMHLFRASLDMDVDQVPLITAIYRDNLTLCEQVTEEALQPFVQAIRDLGRKAKLLEIFSTVQVVHGKALPTVQTLVLKTLLGSGRVYLLYLNPVNTGEFYFEKEKEDEPFLYHAVLLTTLARCCWGNDQAYLNEAKLQRLLTLNGLFTLLQRCEEGSKWSILRLPLMEFFLHVYLDAQRKSEELTGSEEFLSFVRAQAQELYRLEFVTDTYLKYFDLLLQVLLVYARDYISHEEDELFQDEHSISTLKAFAQAFERCSRKFQGLVLTQELQARVQEFMRMFSISLGAWQVSVGPQISLQRQLSNELERWRQFQRGLEREEGLRQSVEEEQRYFLRALTHAHLLADQLTFAGLMQKYISYLSLVPVYRPRLEVQREVVAVLRGCIQAAEPKDSESPEQARRRVQDELAAYNLCSEVLTLLCYHEFLPDTFHQALLLAIEMLRGGNERVQMEFYLYFVNVPAGEQFFLRIHTLLGQEMEQLASSESRASDLLLPLLTVLQMLCEGHNRDLQTYLHQQTHSRRSHDLVSLCASLLGVLLKRLRASDFLQCSQCFDTVTEFIQGPCKDNQEAVISGSFLDSASLLLSLDESKDSLASYIGLDSQVRDQVDPLQGWMVAHLKYKCMITTHSLLEGHSDTFIMTRLMRGLHLKLLQVNILAFFHAFEVLYPRNYYDQEIFGHADLQGSGKQTAVYRQLVAETPFMVFHLMKKFHDAADPDQRQQIQADIPQLAPQDGSFAMRLLGGVGRLGLGLWRRGSRTARIQPDVSEELQVRKERIYEYLEQHTGNLEVMFNGLLCRVYFPLPPYSAVLSEETKERFHSRADRSSAKAKLMYLLRTAADLELQLRCEYRLQKFISRHWTLTLIAQNIALWRDLGFLFTLIINFVILSSYSAYGLDRLQWPSLLYYDGGSGRGLGYRGTRNVLVTLGVLQILCTACVVLSFLAKTSPYLAVRGWTHSPATSAAGFSHAWQVVRRSLWAGLYICSDHAVLYYVSCIVLSVLGVTTSPLFFAFHMTEVILRFPALQQVVQAVFHRWQRTFLTYSLILTCLYYFSIFGYVFFSQFFGANGDSLFITTVEVYDQGFKSNGGIGGALDDWGNGLGIRVIFDDACNIVVFVVLLNIMLAMIKDTFTGLREDHEASEKDRSSVCFVCGLDKETVERATKRPFNLHCSQDHSEWSYLLFLGYLRTKDATEYTGVESFVWEQYQKKDIQWFPVRQALGVKSSTSADHEIAVRRGRMSGRLKRVTADLLQITSHNAAQR